MNQLSIMAKIQLIVLDFDGVMTDNRVLVSESGKESVWCHRGDGWGIARMKEAGLQILVLSTEENRVVDSRCRKLGIDCIQGCKDKLAMLKELADKRFLKPEQIAYIGNDVNDLSCMAWVGLPIAVADAVPQILSVAKIVTKRLGGHGAVREIADLILEVRNG